MGALCSFWWSRQLIASDQEDWKPVEQLFPSAYASAHAEYIGSSGVQVDPVEAEHLLQLDVYEVPVYGQGSRVNGTIQTLESALSPSRAIPPATEPYWVGETDGPKHLYVLELSGDTSAYLGRSPADVDGRTIIKVGFSRSPSARRDQIQSAYPDGQFKWVIKYPASRSRCSTIFERQGGDCRRGCHEAAPRDRGG